MVSTCRITGLLFAAAIVQALPGGSQKDASNKGLPYIEDAPITPPTLCASGVQIFSVRGSTERSHLGRIAPVPTSIRDAIPGSFITALGYPAKIDAVQYYVSVHIGVRRLTRLVENYVKMCPQSKIALVGYSQGAHVVADLVCGGSSFPIRGLPDKPKPLDPKYNKNIIATLLFGDPTRAANQPWNLGTVTDRSGYFPRRRNDACAPYAKTMQSWCDQKDRWCDTRSPSGTDPAVHKRYQERYTDAAVAFVKTQWESSQKPLNRL
ncbi:hypothetical protein PspLS_11295 [Pyricularia sp. CBS 133598]|nr:hypothetical protein PspLS_11295 [Pyricularia sp. CBS 133598]